MRMQLTAGVKLGSRVLTAWTSHLEAAMYGVMLEQILHVVGGLGAVDICDRVCIRKREPKAMELIDWA